MTVVPAATFFLRLVRDNLMLVVGAAGRVPAASFFCAWLGTILGPFTISYFRGWD